MPHAPDPNKLSPSWKAKFLLIEKAGGPKMADFKALTFGECMKINFNWWAFVFGPFYYFVMGMEKKGFALFGVCLAVCLFAGVFLHFFGLGKVVGSLAYGVGAGFG
jgi:hypothetical protein